MTIEQRLEQVEQENQKIQRTKKRLTVALTMMAVTICAVVTMAATELKRSDFDIVKARHIAVRNDTGSGVVTLGANDGGDGVVYTKAAKGNDLVMLGLGNCKGPTDAGLSHLSGLTNLTSLNLRGTSLTDASILGSSPTILKCIGQESSK